jgi:hypothetical protein
LYGLASILLEAAYGNDHQELGPVLNNLAALYKSRGLYAWAEPLYLRALTVRRLRFGNKHPAVAMGLNNLGCLYQAEDLHASARTMFGEALGIAERVSGPQASLTGTIIGNMAFLADEQDSSQRRSSSINGRWSFNNSTWGCIIR